MRATVIDPFTDDDELRALGRRAREQVERRPQAWEAVARGERDADEVAAERLAAGDTPEAIALARELFLPPDEAEHAAMVDALLEGRASPELRATAVPAAGSPTASAANDSRRPWLWAVVAVAAAVALGWWLVPGRSGSPGEPTPPLLARAPLPAYEPHIETDGGLTSVRSHPTEPDAMPRYRGDTRFEWRVRPTVAAEGEIGARLFVFGDTELTELAAEGLVDVHTTGAVRVAGRIDALGLAPGEWTIAIVVGRPAALPGDPAVVRSAEDTEAWVVRRLRIVIED